MGENFKKRKVSRAGWLGIWVSEIRFHQINKDQRDRSGRIFETVLTILGQLCFSMIYRKSQKYAKPIPNGPKKGPHSDK